MKLVVKSKENSDPIELLLTDVSHRIGRMSDNDLSIQDDSISRTHAELIRTKGGDYKVNDLNSSNGTFLNGNRISSPQRVWAGDVLKIGNLEIAVEEHVASTPAKKNASNPKDPALNLISLEDDFSLSEEDEYNRNPIARGETPPPERNTTDALDELDRAEQPVTDSGRTQESDENIGKITTNGSKKTAGTSHEDFHSKIQSLTSDLDNALDEISRLHKINERQLSEPGEASDQSEEAATLRVEIDQSHDDIAALRSEIIDLEDKLALSERAQAEGAAQLQHEAERSHRKHEALQAEIIELEGRLEESERNQTSGAAELEQETVQDREDNEALQAEIIELKDKLAESERLQSEEAANLKQETSQTHEENEALRSEILELKDKLAESERNQAAGVARSEQEAVQSHEDNEVLRSEILELKDKLAESERNQAAEAAELEQETVQSHEENEALRSEIVDLKDKLAESERNQSEEAGELKQEIAASQENNAALESEINDLTDKLAESERKLFEISQEKAQVESDTIAQLQKQIAEITAASEAFEKTKKTLTESNQDLEQQLEAAKTAGQVSAEGEANLRQDKAELIGKLKEAESNSAKLESQIKKATSSISKNEKLIEKLQGQLKDSESRAKDARKLKTKLGSTERKQLATETKVSQLQEKLASAESETEEVRQQLDTAERNYSELEEELAQSKKARDEIESARDDLNLQLNRRERSIAKLEKVAEELEFKLKESDKEKARILSDLELTKEGLSEALNSTQQRLDDASKNLKVEIYLREAAEKQLREAVANLENKPHRPETVALSSEDTNLNRISHLTEDTGEEKSEEMLAFEARLEALYPSDNGGKRVEPEPTENGNFPKEEFYRQLLEKLDLVDSFAKLYENKWRYSKVAEQFAQLKDAFLELLETYSVNQFDLEPGTALGTHQKHRFDLAPNEDGTVPKIDPFGNTQVAETVYPGFVFLDGSREVILRKAKVSVN